MTETNWRELCRELVDELNGLSAHIEATTPFERVLSGIRAYNRARAALAAAPDGPAVPTGREPASVAGELSDEELAQAAKAAIHDYKYPTELVYFLDSYSREYEPFLLALRAAIAADRARRSAPVAEGIPSDKELESDFRAWWKERYGESYFGAAPLVSVIEWAQHVISRFGGHPATRSAPVAEAQPGPSIEELGPLIAWLAQKATQAADSGRSRDAGMLTWALHVVGEQVDEDAPAPVPVPVSERLPGAGDCAPWPDEPGEAPWCWVFVKDLLDEDSWERRAVTSLTCHPPMYTHWLPAHAIPTPPQEAPNG